MHVSCLRHNADRKCYDCKTEFPIRDLVSSLKRHHKEDTKNEASHQSDDDQVIGSAKKRRKIDDESEVAVENARKFLLSIKSDEVAIKLDKYIRELKAKNDLASQQQDQNTVMKTRRNARENFTYSLLVGVEEANERGDFEMLISAMGLHAGSKPDQDTILQYCSKIGLSIESGMFAQAQS